MSDRVIEFAKKNADKEVIVKRPFDKFPLTARVVGYYDHGYAADLIVDFPNDKQMQSQCWSFAGVGAAIITLKEKVDCGYSVEIQYVRLAVRQNPYPNVCKLCKSPARINKSVAICSNAYCKLDRKYLKQLAIQAYKVCKDDKAINGTMIVCPKCGNTDMSSRLKLKLGEYKLKCNMCKGMFIVHPSINDRTYMRANNYNPMPRLYIYNGTKFVEKESVK